MLGINDKPAEQRLLGVGYRHKNPLPSLSIYSRCEPRGPRSAATCCTESKALASVETTSDSVADPVRKSGSVRFDSHPVEHGD